MTNGYYWVSDENATWSSDDTTHWAASSFESKEKNSLRKFKVVCDQVKKPKREKSWLSD